MKLKRLELYGFKSFPQRTEIVFQEGITGIVGPNGSGKSNIGDAIRWVLGEQSAKQLRGDKMEDVIFSGTEKRKPMSYCEVTLVFDNQDKKLHSDYSELQVTRRVYRNGESEYMLNKTACRLKDIVELFRDTGIGKEGYSMIGQGRIDNILSPKGEERRQIFEEAAGIVKYRSRKDEARRRLEHTEENLARVEDILSELNDRLEPLAGQAETAKRYLELSARLKDLELNVFLIRHDKYKERLAALDETLLNIAAVLEENANRLATKMTDRQQLEEVIAQAEADVTAAHEALLAANERWHLEQTEKEKLSGRIEAEENNLARLTEEEAHLKERHEALSGMYNDAVGGIAQKDALLDKLTSEREQLESKLENAQADATRAEEALEKHKNEIMQAVNRESDLRSQQTRQTTLKSQMQQRVTELTAARESLALKVTELEENSREAAEALQEVKNNLAGLRAEADRLNGQSADMGRRLSEKSSAMQENYAQAQTVQSRLHTLEELARDFQGYNNSVRQALTYAKRMANTRVRGVVAMLMQVPKQYETAIDMVLGAALQNIVVEDESSAKELISYLRQGQYGRATFLPMSSVTGRSLNAQEAKVLQMPGCIGIASDLIHYEPEYRPIMENLLGRTVIAADFDTGTAIMRASHYSFRLVTLQGDVMNTGGSITGGSVHSKASSLLGREREIQELKQELQRRKEQLVSDRAEIDHLERERQEVKRLLAEATASVHQEEISVVREQEHAQHAAEALEAHHAQTEEINDALQQLAESIAQIDEDLSAINRQNSDAQMNQEEMAAKTILLQDEVNRARQILEEVRDEATGKLLTLRDTANALESLNRDSARIIGEMESSAASLALCTDKQKQVAQVLDGLKESLARSDVSLERLQAAVQQCRQDVDNTESRRNDKQAEMHELQNRIEEIRQEGETESEKLRKAEVTKARIEGDFKTMQDRIWNSYELTYAGAMEFKWTEPFVLTEAETEAASLKSEIRQMGTVHVGAIEEYTVTKERYDQLYIQKEDLVKARDDLNALIARLLRQMESQFVEEFSKLQVHFQETFSRLFGGGRGELRLSDPNDALNCNIDIIVQPPGKKLQLLSLFSGGERALTAIAILFAMLKLKPTPFCVLDEIEAALDEANVAYYADYLKEFSQGTQFIVVSHRKGTMERCDSLFGVAMEEKGVSRIVSVSLSDYE